MANFTQLPNDYSKTKAIQLAIVVLLYAFVEYWVFDKLPHVLFT